MRIKIIIISGYNMYLRRSTSKFLYGNCFGDIKRASILYPPITLILPSLHTTYNRVESGHISIQRYRINPQNPCRPYHLRGKEVHKNIHLKRKNCKRLRSINDSFWIMSFFSFFVDVLLGAAKFQNLLIS